MAHIRGTAGYNLGAQDNRFGGPGRADATNDPSPLDQIREQTSKIEDWLDTISDPVKPYVYLLRRAVMISQEQRASWDTYSRKGYWKESMLTGDGNLDTFP